MELDIFKSRMGAPSQLFRPGSSRTINKDVGMEDITMNVLGSNIFRSRWRNDNHDR
jgi:hypothetical protein